MNFDRFDLRRYPTLPVKEGYGEWARTYEAVVQDEMDLRLLERVATVAWPEVRRAIDLACGTGRIGRWLRAQGVGAIDGVDLTPEMLAQAHPKEVYDRLLLGDLRATGLPPATYDLVTVVLVDEHLRELRPISIARRASPWRSRATSIC
jgi:predicted TPR repeat methyltransferase